jgi:S1-C subfamily serine protease
MKPLLKTAAVITLALSVSACDAGVQLAATGAVALFGLGAAGISAATQNQQAYCQSGSQIYTQYGGCGSGTAISSEEYQRLYKERAEKETQEKIAANEAARSAKTYCLSSISSTPYMASSGTCQASDQSISEDRYRSAKEDQVKSLSAPPSGTVTDGPEAEIAAADPPAPAASPSIEKSPRAEDQPAPTPAAFASNGLPIIPDDAQAVSSGTAFFIAPHGILLTNHHVIADCRWLGIIDDAGDIHSAVPVADSKRLDLAVIRSDFEDNAVATFAQQTPDIGDDSFVAGYPLLDKLWSLNFTNGIVSAVSPFGDQELLQTTAAVQHGNSGGPMFDASGHVAGVVAAKLKDDAAENVSFAIKAKIAAAFVSEAGISPRLAGRGTDEKASAIAKTAKRLVLPALCFQRE